MSHTIHLSNESIVRQRFSRRGGAYIIVLGAATMLTVVGLSAIAISRASIARVSTARDWSAAGVMAESAIEGALSVINTDSAWRTRFAAAPLSSEMTFGGGGRRSMFHRPRSMCSHTRPTPRSAARPRAP